MLSFQIFAADAAKTKQCSARFFVRTLCAVLSNELIRLIDVAFIAL